MLEDPKVEVAVAERAVVSDPAVVNQLLDMPSMKPGAHLYRTFPKDQEADFLPRIPTLLLVHHLLHR